MRGCGGGACVVAGGHAWLPGGVCGCWACVVAGGGGRGMRGCRACMGYDEIRSMSGRYASYWNAFFFHIDIDDNGTSAVADLKVSPPPPSRESWIRPCSAETMYKRKWRLKFHSHL